MYQKQIHFTCASWYATTWYLFSWHKGTEHIIITYALMISTWTLFFYQLEDMKRAWEKITNFQSFYLVLQSTNIIIRPWWYWSKRKKFWKSFFHKFWMPLKSDTFDTTQLLFDTHFYIYWLFNNQAVMKCVGSI